MTCRALAGCGRGGLAMLNVWIYSHPWSPLLQPGKFVSQIFVHFVKSIRRLLPDLFVCLFVVLYFVASFSFFSLSSLCHFLCVFLMIRLWTWIKLGGLVGLQTMKLVKKKDIVMMTMMILSDLWLAFLRQNKEKIVRLFCLLKFVGEFIERISLGILWKLQRYYLDGVLMWNYRVLVVKMLDFFLSSMEVMKWVQSFYLRNAVYGFYTVCESRCLCLRLDQVRKWDT